MNNEIDLNKYQIRTDLAIETLEQCSNNALKEEIVEDNIKITRINIDKENASKINKKSGYYVTIQFEDITNFENREKIGKVLENEIKKMLEIFNIDLVDEILIIGLGNQKSTPDALGPLTINNILVTRHLFNLGEKVKEGIRSVAALNPGVTGETGIETLDIINNVIKVVKPKCVIIVDALAASSINRVNKTIQMTDTGIHPGSGVGNMRKEISKDTLGVPVLAVGVPTVVDAVTIVNDSIDYLFKHISYLKENSKKSKLVVKHFDNYQEKIANYHLTNSEKENLGGIIGSLDDNTKKSLLKETLDSLNYNLIVTPKEIDYVIEKLSVMIASALNNALHQDVNHF